MLQCCEKRLKIKCQFPTRNKYRWYWDQFVSWFLLDMALDRGLGKQRPAKLWCWDPCNCWLLEVQWYRSWAIDRTGSRQYFSFMVASSRSNCYRYVYLSIRRYARWNLPISTRFSRIRHSDLSPPHCWVWALRGKEAYESNTAELLTPSGKSRLREESLTQFLGIPLLTTCGFLF